MASRTDLLVAAGTLLAIALPHGVKMAALGLDEGSGSSRLWLGLPLLALGILGLECLPRCVAVLRADAQDPTATRSGKPLAPEKVREMLSVLAVLPVVLVLLLQFIGVFQFVLLLDMHVHLYAACYFYLLYLVGAVVILAVRWGSWASVSGWEARYLQWGWAPLVAFGVPLSLPALKAAGWVPGLS